MTREQVEERILDPSGPPRAGTPERAAFDGWLERDAELRERFERQRELFAAMDLWEAPQPSAGFDPALRERIEREPEPFWAGLWSARPWWAAAAVAALAAWLFWAPATPVSVAPAPEQAAYVEEVDQALDDLEMLIEFEALTVEAEGEGRS